MEDARHAITISKIPKSIINTIRIESICRIAEYAYYGSSVTPTRSFLLSKWEKLLAGRVFQRLVKCDQVGLDRRLEFGRRVGVQPCCQIGLYLIPIAHLSRRTISDQHCWNGNGARRTWAKKNATYGPSVLWIRHKVSQAFVTTRRDAD